MLKNLQLKFFVDQIIIISFSFYQTILARWGVKYGIFGNNTKHQDIITTFNYKIDCSCSKTSLDCIIIFLNAPIQCKWTSNRNYVTNIYLSCSPFLYQTNTRALYYIYEVKMIVWITVFASCVQEVWSNTKSSCPICGHSCLGHKVNY